MRRIAVVLAAVIVITACSPDDRIDAEEFRSRTAPESVDGSMVPKIEWQRCGKFDCGTMLVPLDHFNAEAGEPIELVVRRRRAGDTDKRQGAILLNPGGPGAPGIDMVESQEAEFPDAVLEKFDLVAWDPRGTGESSHVECDSDLDYFFATDKSPDTEAEIDENIATSKRLAESCARADNAELLGYLSTTQTVEDMDWIRRALGDDGLTYLGFSYGTYLGIRYAETHPANVRALVLDGPIDPGADSAVMTLQQSVGFERALAEFFVWCDEHEACQFSAGGDSEAAFARLMANIDDESLPAETNGEQRQLGPGETDLGVAVMLYFGESMYEDLAAALAEAVSGDGSMLLTLADFYTGRDEAGKYDGSMSAFYSIACLDSTSSTVEQLRESAVELETAAPFLGEANAWLGLPCVYWPVPPDPLAAPHAVNLSDSVRILVTATDGDPATPIEWARSLSEQIDAPLLVARSDQHTAFTAGDDCVHDAIIGFLVDPDSGASDCSTAT